MLPTYKKSRSRTFVVRLLYVYCEKEEERERDTISPKREREAQKKRTILIEKNRKNKTFPIEYIRLP